MWKIISVAIVLLAFGSLIGNPATIPGQAAAQEGQTLTDVTLKEMLTGLQYEAKPLKKGYLITIKTADNWSMYVQLVLSADTTKLGMNANLGIVANPQNITAAQWLALLEANSDIDPSVFYFDKTQKKLFMHRVLDNHGITPPFLKGQIEMFTNNIHGTAKLWNFTK